MARSWPAYVLPAVLLVAAVAYFVRTEPVEEPAVATPRGPALAFLGGLATGEQLGEWTVRRMVVTMSPTNHPQLAVELERKGSGITVWITRKENISTPPLATEKYALTFGHARPYGDPIPPEAYQETMNALAERLRKTESSVPPPEGM